MPSYQDIQEISAQEALAIVKRGRRGSNRELLRQAWQEIINTGLAWDLGDPKIRARAEQLIRRGILRDRRRAYRREP